MVFVGLVDFLHHWHIKYTDVTAYIAGDSCTYLSPVLRGRGRAPWSSMSKLIGLTKALAPAKHKKQAQFILMGISKAFRWVCLAPSCFQNGLSSRKIQRIWANPAWGHRVFVIWTFFLLLTFSGLPDGKTLRFLPWTYALFGAVVSFHPPSGTLNHSKGAADGFCLDNWSIIPLGRTELRAAPPRRTTPVNASSIFKRRCQTHLKPLWQDCQLFCVHPGDAACISVEPCSSERGRWASLSGSSCKGGNMSILTFHLVFTFYRNIHALKIAKRLTQYSLFGKQTNEQENNTSIVLHIRPLEV